MIRRREFLKSVSISAAVGSNIAAMPASQASSALAVPPLPRPDDPKYWDKLRDQFLLARDKVFFNNGTIGAMPKVVVERVVEHLRTMATDLADWDYKGTDWIAGYGAETEFRAKAARLVNADVKEVALTENVTEAMSSVADGLNLAPGSEVIITDQEHPGGQSSWLLAQKRRDIAVKTVKVPKPAHDPEEIIELITAAITPKTKVIAISHIISGSGAILPVKEIAAQARQRNVFTVFDGAHALGQIPVDVKEIGCDAYVSCFHKWLLAPAGTGFLYVRHGEADGIWSTLASSQWDNHEDNGYRFSQRGTGSLSLLMGMDAALDFHSALTPERVQNRIKYLGDYLRDGLSRIPGIKTYSPSHPAMCAGITVYNLEGFTGVRLQDELWRRGRLRPRSLGDVYGVRHCTHIYNSTEEIDRSLRILRELSKA